MNKLFHSNKIEVRDSSKHGRGVFAKEDIKSGEMLEECHYIVVDYNILTLIITISIVSPPILWRSFK